MPRREEKAPEGAPEWMVTYGDMVTLVMCFFVILVAMSEIKKERLQIVVDSVRKAFGYEESSFPAPSNLKQLPSSVFEKIVMDSEVNPGGAVNTSAVGKQWQTTTVKEGLKITFGGRATFAEGSAELTPEAREQLRELARTIKGFGNWVDVRGHCSRSLEDVPPGGTDDTAKVVLSSARAMAVAEALEDYGVRPRRMRVTAVADRDPLVKAEMTDSDARSNRRFEVILSEDVIKDEG